MLLQELEVFSLSTENFGDDVMGFPSTFVVEASVSGKRTVSAFSPKDGHGMSVRNVGMYLRIYMALKHRTSSS
jgi:hypothetical protein